MDKKADKSQIASSVTWENVSGKPSTFKPSSHTHDDRYYTESEINTKLNNISFLKPVSSPTKGYFSVSDRITYITWDDSTLRLKVMIDRSTYVYLKATYS